MDTRNKRSSAIMLTLPWRGQYPEPDGALSQLDWQQVANLYAGILAASPSGAVFKTAKFTIVGDARDTQIEGEARDTQIEGEARNTMIIGDPRPF